MKRVFLLVLLASGHALAYDAHPTHVGLTERAAHAADLHRVLAQSWGLPLGLYEPLHAAPDPALEERLGRLAVQDGLRPDAERRNSALGWLLAGAALEAVPAVRTAHHFFEPRTQRGLGESGAATSLFYWFFGDREVGGSFDLAGKPAPDWVSAPLGENAHGLAAWLEAAADAARGATRPEREAACVRALIALGAMSHVLEDMGVPANVRNDFKAAHLERVPRSSVWDERSGFERLVARLYGRLGIPDATAEPAVHPTLRAHFAALASSVQSRFFSRGTLPRDRVLPLTFGAEAPPPPEGAPAFPEPRVGEIDPTVDVGTVVAPGVGPLVRYRTTGSVATFFLDEEIHRTYARILLPEVVRATAGFMQFLLRGRLKIEKQGEEWVVTNQGVPLRSGTVEIFFEDEGGTRRRAGAVRRLARATAPGQELARQAHPGPAARRVIALFRGADEAREPLVAIQDVATLPPEPPAAEPPPPEELPEPGANDASPGKREPAAPADLDLQLKLDEGLSPGKEK